MKRYLGKFVSESRNEITKDGSNKKWPNARTMSELAGGVKKRINKGRGRMKEK